MANYYTIMTPVHTEDSIRFTDDEIEILMYMDVGFEDDNYIYSETGPVLIEGESDFIMRYDGNPDTVIESRVFKLYMALSDNGQNDIGFDSVVQNALKRVKKDNVYCAYSMAHYCDKARPDSSHGTAIIITKYDIESNSTNYIIEDYVAKNNLK